MKIHKLKHVGKLFKLSKVCKSVFTPNQSKSNQADWMPPWMTFASNMSWTTFTAQQSVFVLWLPIMNLSNAVPTTRLHCCCVAAGPTMMWGPPPPQLLHNSPSCGCVLNYSKLISVISPIRESRFLTSFNLSGTLTCYRWLANSKEDSRPLVTTAPPLFPTAFVPYVESMAVFALWEKQQLWFLLSPQLPLSLPAMKMSCEGKNHSAVL